MKPVGLGSTLCPEDVIRVARGAKVILTPAAKKKITAARKTIETILEKDDLVYGINTGFGILSNVRIDKTDLAELQENLIRSHATAVGPPLGTEHARAVVFLRAATLAQGHSGVRPVIVETLIQLLNKNVTPYIPEQGSVGACGDLAPLAHVALVLMGEGHVLDPITNTKISSKKALESAKIKPLKLAAKEGLALINGTQFMTALACFALVESETLLAQANIATALTVEALKGTQTAFDPRIQQVRPHPGQVFVADHLRELLGKKQKSQIQNSHSDCDRVQDPYSLRCVPQVHGVSLDTLKFVRDIVTREINAVTDNPLVFPQSGDVLSGGNFHGQYIAMAMDFLAIAMAEIANISERRIEKLVNPAISGLPAFLTENSGLNSGFMIVQVAAASLVSENKTLCHPAVVDSIPTSADKEDHVSMGAWAARKALQVVTNTRRVVAMEWIAACQGLDFHQPLKSTPALEAVRSLVRERSAFRKKDAAFYEDIERIEALLRQADNI